jgi:hypothetical protein
MTSPSGWGRRHYQSIGGVRLIAQRITGGVRHVIDKLEAYPTDRARLPGRVAHELGAWVRLVAVGDGRTPDRHSTTQRHPAEADCMNRTCLNVLHPLQPDAIRNYLRFSVRLAICAHRRKWLYSVVFTAKSTSYEPNLAHLARSPPPWLSGIHRSREITHSSALEIFAGSRRWPHPS